MERERSLRERVGIALTLAVLAMVALGLAPGSAHAANLLTNPGFEDGSCGATPCGWTASFATLTRDTAVVLSGTASGKVTANAGSGRPVVGAGQCVALSPGTYEASYMYSFLGTSVVRVFLEAVYWETADCTPHFIAFEQASGLTGDSSTQTQTGTFTAPAGTQSASVSVGLECLTFPDPCEGGESAYFDDVSFGPALNPPGNSPAVLRGRGCGDRHHMHTGREGCPR